MSEKTIVYILSTPFAGSHFLSLLLGSNSRSRHVGELQQLLKPEPDLSECDFRPGDVLAGIGPTNIREVYDIIWSRLGPEVDVLVDTSKRFEWASLFLKHKHHRRKYIHLIRDPRALVRRWMLNSTLKRSLNLRQKLCKTWPARAPVFLTTGTPYIWMYDWLRRNLEIETFLLAHQLDTNIVTYRDLATNTAGEVARLMNWIGLPFEPSQLEYWKFEHIGTQKRAYEWVKEQKASFVDLRWRTELPAEVQKGITQNRQVQEYLTAHGLVFVDDGLHRQETST